MLASSGASTHVESLVAFFVHQHAAANGRPVLPLEPAALARLQSHAWRGNVRELDNCVHRAVLLAKGDVITAADIVLGGRPEALAPSAATSSGQETGSGVATLSVGRSLADVERDLIIDTLGHTRGNRTHAATILGISIRTLRNKLKQYDDAGVAVPAPAAAGAVG